MFGSAKKEEAKLKALVLDSLIDTKKDAYILLKASDLSVAYVSPSFATLFGIPVSRFENDIFIVHSFMGERAARDYQRALEAWDGNEPFTYEMAFPETHVHAAQTVRVVINRVEGGNYYLATACNIDHEVELQKQHEQEVAELRDEAAGRSEFLNKMSHEIRTPLNGISGLLELIDQGVKKGEDVASPIAHAQQLSSYMLSLVNDILDMSRIESGKVELDHSRIDLKGLVHEWQSMFGNMATDKNIDYQVELVDATIRYVMGDRMRLSQIVVNFISNALKFTPQGGRVTVAVRQMYVAGNNVHLLFRVSDTGKGIEPEFLSRIFRPFEQENATIARNYGGSGLGMAISDSLARLMGGQIMVESSVGEGSDFGFYITLPIAAGDQSMDAPIEGIATPEQEEKAESLNLSGTTMLLAEDNDVNALITQRLFEAHDIKIERAHNGIEVQDVFANNAPGTFAAILMDIQMPICDGWEAARAIRAMDRPDAKTMPIVALSANAYIEDIRKSADAGMNGHISKPIDYNDLISVLRTVMSSVNPVSER